MNGEPPGPGRGTPEIEPERTPPGQIGVETTLDADPHAAREPGRDPHHPTLDSGPGEWIGPYRLLQLLGEGGFGAVYLAEQTEPVRRQVALKVIKPGMDSQQVLARFEQERQALALMDHAGIAKVFDAGTTASGRPFFAMELVRGEPITQYCDRQRLPIRERLELFAQVCSAVQHAHTKGIIHRDIKPSNVLVSNQEGEPLAKVIDFGIVKAMAGHLTDRTFFTEHRQLIGTPEYMSPEQAEGSLDIDTRTDVYALGVLLYELLTGTLPFDPKSLRVAAYGEILRIIREVEPPRPSTRLSRSVATIAGVAASRATESAKLAATLRGELDWIVMKSLEKDRQRRYETPNSLAMDVRRHLAGEVVLAAPPSTSYRLRKFVRRHRVPVTAASLVLAALLAAVVGIAWQARVARTQAVKAELVADFMSKALSGVGPSVALGRDTTMLREMMSAAAARVEKGELAGAPEAELALRGTIGGIFRDLALYDEATKMLEPAVPLARRLHRGDHDDVATALGDLAKLYSDRGDDQRAEPLYREELAMDGRLHPGDHPSVATDLSNLAGLYDDRGDAKAAEPLARQALAMRRRLFPGDHEDVAESLNNLATVIGGPTGLGDRAGAEVLFREALAMNRRLLPRDHPRIAAGLNNLSVILKDLGRHAEAEAMARESLEIRRRIFPGDHPYVATGLNNLALLIQDGGDLVAPEPLFRESLAMRRRLYPEGHVSVANDLANLARLLLERGDAAAAEPLYREAAALYDRTSGDGFWPTGNARLGLGRALLALSRFAEAEVELLRAQRLLANAPSAPPTRRRQSLEALARLYESWNAATPAHRARAAEWRKQLATLDAATLPAAAQR
ncbi:MAG: serine/threonine-protein kinase [Acidobacteriota bacterium]